MKTRTPALAVLLLLAGCASGPPPGTERPLRTAEALDVQLREVPSQPVLIRDVIGSYAQHPELLAELYRIASAAGLRPGAGPIGIYPMDPDTVPETRLRWQLALPVEGTGDVPTTHRIDTLPAVRALVVESTVARSHEDGLALKIWTLDRRMIQTAPTRMEFLGRPADRPEVDRTRIVFPVDDRSYFEALGNQNPDGGQRP